MPTTSCARSRRRDELVQGDREMKRGAALLVAAAGRVYLESWPLTSPLGLEVCTST